MEMTALRQQTQKELAAQQRMQSWRKLGVALAVGLAGVAAGLFVLLRLAAPLWPLVACGLLLLAVWHAGRAQVNRQLARYQHAINLVQHAHPVAIRLTPTKLVAFEGRLFRADAQRCLFAFQTAKYSAFGNNPTQPIWIWRNPLSQEAVGNDGGQVAIGKALDDQGATHALRRAGRIWLGLSSVTLLLVGIFVGDAQWVALPQAQQDLDRAVAAHMWPQITATVIRAQAREIRISRGKSTVSAWVPDIRYRFVVHGQIWHGDTRRVFETPLDGPDKVTPILNSYPVGATIAVAVSPDNPALAVIEPGHEQPLQRKIRDLRQVTLVLLLVGGLLISVFIVLSKWQKRLGEQIQTEVFLNPHPPDQGGPI